MQIGFALLSYYHVEHAHSNTKKKCSLNPFLEHQLQVHLHSKYISIHLFLCADVIFA